jgi:hypothetical protein
MAFRSARGVMVNLSLASDVARPASPQALATSEANGLHEPRPSRPWAEGLRVVVGDAGLEPTTSTV